MGEMDQADTIRPRSLLANSVFGMLAWFSPIVLGFVSTPILVGELGSESYGVYAIIVGFLSYSFTFGIGRVASKYVPEYTAAGETEKIAGAVSAVFWFSLAVGTAGALTLALLARYIVTDLLLLPEHARADAETALYIACVTGVMAMLSQVFANTLQGTHRFGSYLVLSTLGAVLLSTGNIIIALAGFGIPVLIGWNLFSVAVTGTIYYIAAARSIPEFHLTLHIDGKTATAVIKYGAGIILYQVIGNILFILERTWIVRNFGPDALTFYVVPMLLGLYLHGMAASFAQVLFPRVNELLADRARMIALYKTATRAIIALIIFAVVTLICSGREFLILWVGAEFGVRSYDVLAIHGITYSLYAGSLAVWNLAEAFKAPSLNIVSVAVWLIVGALLMISFGQAGGIEGVAVARLAGPVVTLPMTFYIERRFLGQVLTGFWLALLVRVAVAGAAAAAVQLLLWNYLPIGWLALIAVCGAGAAAYVSVLFVLRFFSWEEIARAKMLAGNIFGGGKQQHNDDEN